MELTKEQQLIITETINNKDGIYAIEACAGSGKSFTIFKSIEYIKEKEPNAKILYIVFNKANQLSAESKLRAYNFTASPVVVRTCNAYGYDKWLKTIGKFEVVNTFDKQTIYDFQQKSYKHDIKYSKHRPFKQLLEMYDSSKFTLDTFCEDMLTHWDDDYEGLDAPKNCEIFDKKGNPITKYGIPCDKYSVITKDHIPVFKKMVEYYIEQKKYTHGMYMKSVAYSNNDKTKGDNWDYVFFDEAQDANYFVLKLLKKQSIKKLYFVGDTRQSIYNFGGINENVFEQYKFTKKYKLSKSFRFGQAISNIANIILNGDGLKVKGTEQEGSVDINNCTRLYRTNAKLFKDALSLAYRAVRKGVSLKLDFMRTEQESKLNDDMFAFIALFYKYTDCGAYSQCFRLLNNLEPSEIIKSFEKRLNEIKNFYRIYNEMYDFLNDDIHNIFNYVKEDNNFIIKLQALEQCKYCVNPTYHITLVTMHRSKGLEWDNVVIAEPTKLFYTTKDSDTPKKNPDYIHELNLGYVAVTRSRKTLNAEVLLDEIEDFGIDLKNNTFRVREGKALTWNDIKKEEIK